MKATGARPEGRAIAFEMIPLDPLWEPSQGEVVDEMSVESVVFSYGQVKLRGVRQEMNGIPLRKCSLVSLQRCGRTPKVSRIALRPVQIPGGVSLLSGQFCFVFLSCSLTVFKLVQATVCGCSNVFHAAN